MNATREGEKRWPTVLFEMSLEMSDDRDDVTNDNMRTITRYNSKSFSLFLILH